MSSSSLPALAIAILAACGGSDPALDSAPPPPDAADPACVAATTYSNLASIEQKIFPICSTAGCHNGSGVDAGRLDLRVDMSHGALVGAMSRLAPPRVLVVPGDPAASYLLVMIGQLAPDAATPPAEAPSIGFMPSNTGGRLLCVEQRGAIARWITMGAADD